MFSLLVCFALVYSGTALKCYSEQRSGQMVAKALTEEKCGAEMDTCYTQTVKLKPAMGSVVSIIRACGLKSMCDSLCDGPDKDDSVESCKVKCCDPASDLCNKLDGPTPTQGPALKCYHDIKSGSFVMNATTKQDCEAFFDSCSTTVIESEHGKTVMRGCNLEAMCQKQCEEAKKAPGYKSCNAKCCKGNLCNVEGDSAPTTIAPGLQCYVGQISNGQAIKPIKTEECPSYTDSCYTMEVTQNQDDLKSVAYSCGTESMCASLCKTDSFEDAKSCEVKCCTGSLCNKQDTSSASVLAVHVVTTLLLLVVAFLVAV